MPNKYADKIKQRKETLKLKKNIENNNPSEGKKFYSFVYWGTLFFICLLGFFFYISFKYDSLNEWIIQIAIITLVLFLLVILLVPKLYVQSLQTYSDNSFDQQKEKLKLEDDARKTVAQIIGGVVVIGGIIFTYNTFRLQQDTYRLQQEGQFTDRFTKAITQIGDEKLEVRLGGLYALERIAKDSPKDRWAVMEILSAYIREKSKKQKDDFKDKQLDTKISEEDIETKYSFTFPETDIKTAITIINRRSLKDDDLDFKFDLSDANLRFSQLKNANFVSANFSSADLKSAEFESSDLSNSYFQHANLYFTNLSRTNLSNSSFQFANLTATNFRNANLTNASFFMATLKAPNFSEAILKNVRFNGLDLSDARGLTFEQLNEAIIDEVTQLPVKLENRKEELLKTSKKNLETKEKDLNK